MGSNVIRRDIYLSRLIDRRDNGSIKVITGIRRCGKSFLLFELYHDWLVSSGVDPSRIIKIALDDDRYDDLLDGPRLSAHIRELTNGGGRYYVFLDEIQYVQNFERALNGLARRGDLDIYVTGSNSRFLSSDILTEFRGRGDEVRVRPLSFAEFMGAYDGAVTDGWAEYVAYGGMPLILSRRTDEMKASYLSDLFRKVYLTDIIERNSIRATDRMDALVNILASSVGSLTNPSKLARTFESKGVRGVSDKTLCSYIDMLLDAFIITRAERYDIKGKRYIASPYKYYFADVGLRNARLNFRQQEENHIMENIIFNELLTRGYNVDVGVAETVVKDEAGRRSRRTHEVDFVCSLGSKRYYIQSALTIADDAKMLQETASLSHIRDSFKKIVVVRDSMKPWRNEEGILFVSVWDFLLRADSLEM